MGSNHAGWRGDGEFLPVFVPPRLYIRERR
jgi:hypothetical protein